MVWVRRWQVTIVWDHPHFSHKHCKRYTTIVDTAAQERRIMAWALANPHVEQATTKIVWSLDGQLPQQCSNGHRYPSRAVDPRTPHKRWRRCTCGGHFELTCPTCTDTITDPPILVDCQSTA